mgnify:CR=1 FL=1
MKKHISMMCAIICYAIGVIASVYFGLWKMLFLPIHTLAISFRTGGMTFPSVASCGVKILLSTTMAGLIWCIGYMAYNHFKGTEDPDFKAMEEERQLAEKEQKERQTL